MTAPTLPRGVVTAWCSVCLGFRHHRFGVCAMEPYHRIRPCAECGRPSGSTLCSACAVRMEVAADA